ncbi:hypothetical protein SBY92_002167 [Candida maltosa Xu316]
MTSRSSRSMISPEYFKSSSTTTTTPKMGR